jgi:phage/plasmid-like protein (TIGR03299 family)
MNNFANAVRRHAFLKKIETKDVNEAMTLAGHDFEVEMVPLEINGQTIWDKKAVIRKDNGSYLGTVGNSWQPVQPKVIYDMADTLIKETNGSITGTITMQRGSVMGLALTLGQNEFIPGDRYEFNMLLLTSFNMSYTVLAKVLTRRFFCMNQMPSSKQLFSLKHTTFVNERLGAAMKMLAHYNQEITGFQSKMTRLINAPMSDEAALNFFTGLLPAVNEESKRSVTLKDNAVGTFIDLLSRGKGSDWPGVRGTAYGVLNALTEYTNYYKPTRVFEGREQDEVKFESLVFGAGGDFMTLGMAQLLDYAYALDKTPGAPIKVN